MSSSSVVELENNPSVANSSAAINNQGVKKFSNHWSKLRPQWVEVGALPSRNEDGQQCRLGKWVISIEEKEDEPGWLELEAGRVWNAVGKNVAQGKFLYAKRTVAKIVTCNCSNVR